ncbi:MAG TPA: 16S rRNA (adenine(1518)-N(6)/adenine(1519)-N(6))-dimethyltransferase RsmA [Armatimonadota bacterium]|nr:16S rRNA (adenine(1518)-N(6)/adenine(1519)-N(6))-dimethyltransferase RsmA [Armatimonadota bacterium]
MPEPLNLTSPAVVSEILQRRGLRPNRRWGQNFLVDGNLLAKVVDAGDLQPEEAVLEIGPGLGALTRALAGRVRQVVSVEIDPALFATLTEETAADLPNVRILAGDFLQVDLQATVPEHLGPGRHPVVANIPYSITSPIVVRLLEHRSLFDRLVLLVQREVADRLTAAPNTSDYGSLTLFVNLYATARRVALVPRRAFLPAPEVDSAIVRMDVLSEPRYPHVPPERYLAVVHAAFQQRRKNLANALTGPALGWTREQARGALGAAGIDPGRRGETLSPDEFAVLATQWPQEVAATSTARDEQERSED